MMMNYVNAVRTKIPKIHLKNFMLCYERNQSINQSLIIVYIT